MQVHCIYAKAADPDRLPRAVDADLHLGEPGALGELVVHRYGRDFMVTKHAFSKRVANLELVSRHDEPRHRCQVFIKNHGDQHCGTAVTDEWMRRAHVQTEERKRKETPDVEEVIQRALPESPRESG